MSNHICEYCKKPHDGTYGSGRFCSIRCAKKFSGSHVTEDGRTNQIQSLNDNRDKSIQARSAVSINRKSHELYRESIRAVNKSTNNTGLVGKIGELSTIRKFVENNIPVYTPVLDNTKVDLVAEFDGKPQRIQVKTSSRVRGVDNGGTSFLLRSSGNIFNHGIAIPKSTKYGIDEVDYFALYDYNANEVYLLRNTEDMQKEITLRYTDPLSGQKKNIHYASDYQIDRYLALLAMGYDPENTVEPIIFDQE